MPLLIYTVCPRSYVGKKRKKQKRKETSPWQRRGFSGKVASEVRRRGGAGSGGVEAVGWVWPAEGGPGGVQEAMGWRYRGVVVLLELGSGEVCRGGVWGDEGPGVEGNGVRGRVRFL